MLGQCVSFGESKQRIVGERWTLNCPLQLQVSVAVLDDVMLSEATVYSVDLSCDNFEFRSIFYLAVIIRHYLAANL